jgi:hypothetical protein
VTGIGTVKPAPCAPPALATYRRLPNYFRILNIMPIMASPGRLSNLGPLNVFPNHNDLLPQRRTR